MASATLRPALIKAVLVDVHGTLVTPRDMGKSDLIGHVVKMVAGKRVDGTKVRRAMNAWRRKLNQSSPEEYINTPPYWAEVNAGGVLDAEGLKLTEAEALEVHRLLNLHRLYKMHPKRREFVRWLLRVKFDRVKHVVVASNSNQETVAETLRSEGVEGWFKEIYTAERLKVSKPAPKFWSKVLAEIDVPPHEVLMVGNSLLNDAVAAKVGIHTVLILDRFDDAEVREAKRSQLEERAEEHGGDIRVYSSPFLQRVRDFINRRFTQAKK